MKIIKPNAEYIDVQNIPPYQIMEKAGRTCYKSEKNITPESAAKFVKNLAEHKHTAMLEHAHIYMELPVRIFSILENCLSNMMVSDEEAMDPVTPFIHLSHFIPDNDNDNDKFFVSGSFRTFLHMFYSDIAYVFEEELAELKKVLSDKYPEIFEPDNKEVYKSNEKIEILSREEFIEKINALPARNEQKKAILMKHIVHTVVFTCDRGVTHEFVRHRTASFAQESTRYCNYSQDKFSNEITVIEPSFWSNPNYMPYRTWKHACEEAEKAYFGLLESGATPQEARSVLPNSLKTELVITATEIEWQHIVNLRLHGTTGAPHPQIKEVMEIAYPALTANSNNRIA